MELLDGLWWWLQIWLVRHLPYGQRVLKMNEYANAALNLLSNTRTDNQDYINFMRKQFHTARQLLMETKHELRRCQADLEAERRKR